MSFHSTGNVLRPNKTKGVGERLSDIIRMLPAKAVMRITGKSERTVANWRNGVTEMSASDLVELMRSVDAIADEVMAMAGRRPELSAEQRAALSRALAILSGAA